MKDAGLGLGESWVLLDSEGFGIKLGSLEIFHGLLKLGCHDDMGPI